MYGKYSYKGFEQRRKSLKMIMSILCFIIARLKATVDRFLGPVLGSFYNQRTSSELPLQNPRK